MRITTKIWPLLEFLNDWRDTIYYSLGLILIGWLFYYNHPDLRTITDGVFGLIFVREFIRGSAWSWCLDSANKVPVCSCVFLSSVIFNPYQYFRPHSMLVWWEMMAIGINILIFVSSYKKTGGIKSIWRIYTRDLFDYPRKQKSPKHRWDKLKNKIKSFVDKFSPGYLPDPAYRQQRIV